MNTRISHHLEEFEEARMSQLSKNDIRKVQKGNMVDNGRTSQDRKVGKRRNCNIIYDNLTIFLISMYVFVYQVVHILLIFTL